MYAFEKNSFLRADLVAFGVDEQQLPFWLNLPDRLNVGQAQSTRPNNNHVPVQRSWVESISADELQRRIDYGRRRDDWREKIGCPERDAPRCRSADRHAEIEAAKDKKTCRIIDPRKDRQIRHVVYARRVNAREKGADA